MVFHKVSPTICFLLSVLLLFLSQETLSRELIQVAPYGKYFSSIMVLGFPVIASTLCRPAKFICSSGSCRRWSFDPCTWKQLPSSRRPQTWHAYCQYRPFSSHKVTWVILIPTCFAHQLLGDLNGKNKEGFPLLLLWLWR